MNSFEKRKKIIYDFICDDFYVPMKQKEIAMLLQVPREERENLKLILDALVEEGKINLSKRGKYTKGEAKHFKGIFRAHQRGFGFVTVEGEEEDIYISERDVNGAFDGDEVEVVITRYNQPGGAVKRKEGKILQVITRSTQTVVGLYEKRKSFGFVLPDDQKILKDIYIPEGKDQGAENGQKVVAELTSFGGEYKKPEGKIIRILGDRHEPGVDILSIAMTHKLPLEFPEKVLEQAERVGKPVSKADMEGREDLREWQMVTIDGEDAKDLDDAVSLTMEGENYLLGVHIADVTNYVQENSALDKEALKRGTSVYLVDRVIPMLPKTLSNGICSLNAGEERLALSCIMTIDPTGELLDHRICESVIRVDCRMTYTSVAKILEGQDPEERKLYEELVPMFERMGELSAIIRKRREKRGAIDFDFPESKLVLDEKGRPIAIKPYDRNTATKLIEDFMLMANETVAEEYFWRECPFLYRVHEAPDAEKIRHLSTFFNNFGYHVHVGEEVRPMEIQKLLHKVEGTPQESMIGRLTLRSMQQARYSTENDGHFGLAAKYYTHFTSPIRRYPDLQIHRIIKENLRGRFTEDRREHYERMLSSVADAASTLERRAEEAERDTVKLKKAEYMRNHIGEEFDGVICSVTKWGAYVELPNTIEGLVHVVNMTDDHYNYVEDCYELVGERKHRTYRLGEQVRVRVIGADILQRTIDFEFCEDEQKE